MLDVNEDVKEVGTSLILLSQKPTLVLTQDVMAIVPTTQDILDSITFCQIPETVPQVEQDMNNVKKPQSKKKRKM